MFTASERENFALYGLIKRPNFLPREKLNNARNLIFQTLEEKGIWRNGEWLLGDDIRSTDLTAGRDLVKSLERHRVMIELVNDQAVAAANALVEGRPVFPMGHYPGLLFTLPNATHWRVPHANWHQDMPRLAENEIPGVQIFAFLERVDKGGGGTLAVTGSHRLHNDGVRISSTDLRKKLRQYPYFAELMSNSAGASTDANAEDRLHFVRQSGKVGDVEVRVVEMTGEPGDVYFMDLRVLHTIAPNALRIPRIMLTHRYLLESARIALEGK